MGCGDATAYAGLGYGEASNALEAMLVFDGYNASKELVEGWSYLHKNLLVRGLPAPSS